MVSTFLWECGQKVWRWKVPTVSICFMEERDKSTTKHWEKTGKIRNAALLFQGELKQWGEGRQDHHCWILKRQQNRLNFITYIALSDGKSHHWSSSSKLPSWKSCIWSRLLNLVISLCSNSICNTCTNLHTLKKRDETKWWSTGGLTATQAEERNQKKKKFKIRSCLILCRKYAEGQQTKHSIIATMRTPPPFIPPVLFIKYIKLTLTLNSSPVRWISNAILR